MPPPPPAATPATVAPTVQTGTEKVGDYSHFNNKLTIADFDLLKVSSILYILCIELFHSLI
jgi:hypothetical protein